MTYDNKLFLWGGQDPQDWSNQCKGREWGSNIFYSIKLGHTLFHSSLLSEVYYLTRAHLDGLEHVSNCCLWEERGLFNAIASRPTPSQVNWIQRCVSSLFVITQSLLQWRGYRSIVRCKQDVTFSVTANKITTRRLSRYLKEYLIMRESSDVEP